MNQNNAPQNNSNPKSKDPLHDKEEKVQGKAVPESPSPLKVENASSGEIPEKKEVPSPYEIEIQNLKALLEKEKKEALYLRAEFDTYRRNALKERSELLKFAGEPLIKDLLNILDVLEKALAVDVKPETLESFYKGVQMTYSELKSSLKKFGVQEVETLHKAFDPMCHEALSSEESESIAPGHVLQVLRKPYKLYDKVIRPAQVVVAKEKQRK